MEKLGGQRSGKCCNIMSVSLDQTTTVVMLYEYFVEIVENCEKIYCTVEYRYNAVNYTRIMTPRMSITDMI